MTESAIHNGDALQVLSGLPDNSAHCCVTSPPYYGLRDYGHTGQIGLEETPDAYVSRLVEVFREVRRVLRDDGTLWLNLGDSYASSGVAGKQSDSCNLARHGKNKCNPKFMDQAFGRAPTPHGLKPKDLIGIPWRVAFALQADGWYLRQDIIWHKPNPMPESVRDRCTKAHEYIFLLSKSARYYYDADAIREDAIAPGVAVKHWKERPRNGEGHGPSGRYCMGYSGNGMKRNRRSVWTVSTRPYKGAHFATFPPKLIEPCILAGCPAGGTVLEPFAGSGTTLAVAVSLGRNAVGIELNPEYIELARARIAAASKAQPPRKSAKRARPAVASPQLGLFA